MSEYVEARYAKLVLREARLAGEDVASKLINDLLHDLKSFQNLNSARAQAVTSIRQLSLSLDRPQSLHAREWEAADQAAEAWCRTRFIEKIVLQVRDGPWRGQRRHWQQRAESGSGAQMRSADWLRNCLLFFGGLTGVRRETGKE
jgi:hypothetical protein